MGITESDCRENPKRMRFADEEGLPVMEVKPGFEIQFTLIPQLPGDRGRRADHSVYLQYAHLITLPLLISLQTYSLESLCE